MNPFAITTDRRFLHQRHAASAVAGAGLRPSVRGKFLFVGRDKLYVKGAAYALPAVPRGTGQTDLLSLAERDFPVLRAAGVNCIHVSGVASPGALLDLARGEGIRVLLGLSAERYIGDLVDGSKTTADVAAILRATVQAVAGHPGLLGYSAASLIPAPMVRLLGARRVQRYLERVCSTVRTADRGALVTYVNGATTEYLHLPFLDLACFDVHPDEPEHAAVLARLHHAVGDLPLLTIERAPSTACAAPELSKDPTMTRVRRTFAAGCAGTFVSLSAGDRPGRVERPALHPESLDATSLPLAGLREAFADVPFPADADWPRASVIVCSHNGARTISECLAALQQLEYPDFEVIVVDDGSTDATAAIARTHGFRVIATENRGLSSARNTGLAAATGDIVAYIDDDAFPDPQWLSYLALAFLESRHAGIGGPNVPPPGAGLTADCVAHSPGSPMHMLLSEHEAEHIPGCNMAFRASALRSIGGFDPRLRVAGDDVDVCWRIRQRGWTLGFSPGALVWHRRRGTVRAYWRQQRAYGTAEALLERKWRERYNTAGHVAWAGSSKAGGAAARWGAGIYGGRQEVESVYRPALNLVAYLPLIPEWYLLIAGLAALSAMAILWKPLLLVLPLLGAAVGTSLLYAAVAGTSQPGPSAGVSMAGLRRRMLIMFLHLVQPVARLTGRLGSGLWPGRWQGPVVFFGVRPLAFAARSEHWVPIEERVRVLEETLRFLHARTVRGGPRDRWELEVRGGLFGAARVLLALEDQAAGTQVLRVRAWPRGRLRAGLLLALFSAPAAWAAWDHAWFVSAVLGAVALAIVLSTLRDCCHAMALVVCALETAHVEGA